jgi:hypothetical protein
MKIRAFDPLRFFVSSEARPDVEYLVDLTYPTKLFPHGRCTCPDFSIRIEPPILHHEKPPRTYCKHCLCVLEMLRSKLSLDSSPAGARRASSRERALATGKRASGSATRSIAALRAQRQRAARK